MPRFWVCPKRNIVGRDVRETLASYGVKPINDEGKRVLVDIHASLAQTIRRENRDLHVELERPSHTTIG